MPDSLELFGKIPLKLRSTRVWRTYTGGRLIEEWQGRDEPVDSSFPEEWIASLVIARNPGREHIKNEGLSLLDMAGEKSQTLKEAIHSDPVTFLGEQHFARYGDNTGVLVKVLDAAERLTIQVHPDAETADRLFHSSFGKTEAWYILGGREINGEPPYVLFGFKPGLTREKWERMFLEQDIEGMIDSLHKIYVKPGEVYLIEGGIPHAIGPGCFLVEIQEPTDYTIRVERKTPGGLVVPDALCHQGAGFEQMFECFHYECLEEETLMEKWRLKPVIKEVSGNGKVSSLVSYEQTGKFAMDEIEVYTKMNLMGQNTFSILVVVSGSGNLYCNGYELNILKGDQVFLPYGTGNFLVANNGEEKLVVIRCYPPNNKELK